MRRSLSVFVLLIVNLSGFAQNWMQVQRWGGVGSETCDGLALARDGSVFMTGTFQQNVVFGNQTLQSKGVEDIFLLKVNPQGSIVWAKRAGGALSDEATAIATDREGNVICVGNFLQEADFDDLTLHSTLNPQAIFMVKYNPDGQLLWGKSFNGTSFQQITDVTCDRNGDIFLTGYFGDSLTIADTTLITKARTNLWVARFTPQGELQWALQQGQSGDTRGITLGLTNENDLMVAGYFNDTTRIAGTVFIANTSDQDLFLTRISNDGKPLWARKAGGVFDEDVTALAVDSNDHIYLTGYFIGVMSLSEQLSIQSLTGMPDFFVAKYSADGTPLLARALGGSLTQQATDLALSDGKIVVTGFYQGDMNFDGFNFSASNAFSSFVAAFDTNLICQWAKNISAENAVYAMKIAANQNNIWVGGSFLGNAHFDDQIISAPASFDVFLAKASLLPTSVQESPANKLFLAFPNPAKDVLLIQSPVTTYTIQLFNSAGELVYSGKSDRVISLSNLLPGVYLLQFQSEGKTEVQKIFKE